MNDNQKYTTINVRIKCTSCGEHCDEHLITIGDRITLCFSCVDKAKEKTDLCRKEIAEKEIKEIVRLIEGYAVKTDIADIASLLHQAGYRKVE